MSGDAVQRLTVDSKPRAAFVRTADAWVYRVFDLFLWRFLWRWNRGTIRGELPDEPLLLIPNHSSYLDWMLLDLLLRHVAHRKAVFLAKRKVLETPLLANLARHCGAILVDDTSRMKAVALAARLFAAPPADAPPPLVCIFPEGTRSRQGERLPASKGAAWLARKAGVRMVPVALCGFCQVWPSHRLLPSLRRSGLSVHFLPPVLPAAFSDDQGAIDHVMDEVYQALLSAKFHDIDFAEREI